MNKSFYQRECTSLGELLDPVNFDEGTLGRFEYASEDRQQFQYWRNTKNNRWWPPHNHSEVSEQTDPFFFARAYTSLVAKFSRQLQQDRVISWQEAEKLTLSKPADLIDYKNSAETILFLLNELFQIYRAFRMARAAVEDPSFLIPFEKQVQALLGDLLFQSSSDQGLPILGKSVGNLIGVESGEKGHGKNFPLSVSVYRCGDSINDEEFSVCHFPSFLTSQECFSAQTGTGRNWWAALDLALNHAKQRFLAAQRYEFGPDEKLKGHFGLKWHVDTDRMNQTWNEDEVCGESFKDDSHGPQFSLAFYNALQNACLNSATIVRRIVMPSVA